MVDAGLLEEVRRLAARPGGLAHGPRQALGYAEAIEHLEGRMTWPEAIEAIVLHTRQFARAQLKWFRRFEKLHWLDAEADTTTEELADRVEDLWRAHLAAR
jgi:tRNA dimethylallyltransferase